jgi:xanthine/uracil/vitamin C permease (AzgA family)
VFVGVCSLEAVRRVDMEDFVDLWCAFIMFAIMGFTYSIANGISFAFISYSFLQILRYSYQKLVLDVLKRPAWALKEGTNCSLPHPLMIVMALFMVGRFRWLTSV